MSERAVNMASCAKYTRITSSPPRSALGLCGLCGPDTGYLELGSVNPGSGVMFARHDGAMYVGHNPANPAALAGDGQCIERSALGVTLESLITLLASEPGTEPAHTGLPILPRDQWNAGFTLLDPPQGHTDALRFRIYITNPYAHTHTATFQHDLLMHRFG